MEQGHGINARLHTLQLREPFRIAHGVSTERKVVRVQYGDAIGEAPFVPYYDDNPDDTLRALHKLTDLDDLLPEDANRAARLAFSMLRHDHAATAAAMPLWQHLGLPDPRGREACRSIGIPTSLNTFRAKVGDITRQFHMLKLKLGSGDLEHDAAIVAAAREVAPYIILTADVNGGWSPAEAAEMIQRLLPYRLSLIEQPVSHTLGIEGWRELRTRMPDTSVPLFADESVQDVSTLPDWAPLIDGVVVKLLKCAGIAETVHMMTTARSLQKLVLLSCMIESSVGITAAAHLAGLADFIDLDGHLYVANDDYIGVRYDADGRLRLSAESGIGVHPRTP